MDFFTLNLDQKLFNITNKYWNEFSLNSPWNIGYVTKIIEEKKFKNKEEWIKYYFETGKQRQEKMKNLTQEQKDILNTVTFDSSNSKRNNNLKGLITLNLYHGRTEEELKKIGEIFYYKLKEIKPPLPIAIEFCQECVFYRVICETWNGIVCREQNTIETLKKTFPNYTFVKTTSEIDFEFSVDYEVYLENKLVLGLQIKPISYRLAKSNEVIKVREINENKNIKYIQKYKIPIIYVYSNKKGEIEEDSMIELNNLLKKTP